MRTLSLSVLTLIACGARSFPELGEIDIAGGTGATGNTGSGATGNSGDGANGGRSGGMGSAGKATLAGAPGNGGAPQSGGSGGTGGGLGNAGRVGFGGAEAGVLNTCDLFCSTYAMACFNGGGGFAKTCMASCEARAPNVLLTCANATVQAFACLSKTVSSGTCRNDVGSERACLEPAAQIPGCDLIGCSSTALSGDGNGCMESATCANRSVRLACTNRGLDATGMLTAACSCSVDGVARFTVDSVVSAKSTCLDNVLFDLCARSAL